MGRRANLPSLPYSAYLKQYNSAVVESYVEFGRLYGLFQPQFKCRCVGQPSASSIACLSCHDGTVALDSYGGNPGSGSYIGGSDNLTANLSNDHPVSFTYDAALASADGTLFDPTTKTVGALGGKTIDAGMLIGHKLECGSCHDVHADKGNSPTAGNLLVVNNSGSALCLTCHNK